MRKVRSLFFKMSMTAEDEQKTQMYRQEAERQGAAGKFSSIEDFLKSLGLRMTLSCNARVPLARAAQLTQKTNQFNLTTRRYTEGDLQARLSDGRHSLISISVSDRYGDYGVTGLAIMEFGQQEARLDTLLMSCRVLGRNIERVFLDQLVGMARSRGAARIRAEYLRTLKNSQAASFLDSAGFHVLAADEKHTEYLTRLDTYRPSGIDYIEVTGE
jgi:FkbH-like protein